MEIWNANEALKIIERERPTVFIAAPAQLAMLLQEQDFDTYDTSSIRVVYCGTSPLSYETVKAGKEKLNALVLNACGSFEGGGVSGTSYLMGNKQGCTPRVSLITAMKSPSSMNKARKYRAERKEN